MVLEHRWYHDRHVLVLEAPEDPDRRVGGERRELGTDGLRRRHLTRVVLDDHVATIIAHVPCWIPHMSQIAQLRV